MSYARLWFGLLAVLAIAGAPSRAAAQTPIYLVDTLGGTNAIYRVTPATGQLTSIGTLPLSFGDTFGLAALDDNTLLVSTSQGAVLRVTISPFGFTNLGTVLGRLVGLARGLDGNVYAVDESSEELSRITLSPFGKVVIGVIHIGTPAGPVFDVAGGDLVQARDGTWYIWSFTYQTLYRLDVTTAVATEVVPGGPADDASLEPGDVVTGIDGEPISSAEELVNAVAAREPGDRVTLELADGSSVEVELGSRPQDG